jgi:DNA-binding response OmpR family regulator
MIWVVSPDSDTRRLIALNLSKRGLGVLEIRPQDGPVPLDLAQDRPSCPEPQLIILDVGSLDEPGWKVAGALRQTLGIQGTTMILLLSAAPAAKRLASLQPVRWLEKPLAMDALLAQVWESLA